MKKLTPLLFIIFLFINCSNSSDDNNSSNSSNLVFHPPSWIQGTWISYFADTPTGIGYKFTTDNFCQVISSSETCTKETLQTYSAIKEISVSIDEPINTATAYKFSYTIEGSTIKYYFKKISTTKIQQIDVLTDKIIDTLIKQ